mmetsp:Transcript_15920/g.41150  ORF Transcript_15920/g.41150 Transcript_15920/m.41150 type:complete len:261 (-) Transcript_15920:1783-2565(-)
MYVCDARGGRSRMSVPAETRPADAEEDPTTASQRLHSARVTLSAARRRYLEREVILATLQAYLDEEKPSPHIASCRAALVRALASLHTVRVRGPRDVPALGGEMSAALPSDQHKATSVPPSVAEAVDARLCYRCDQLLDFFGIKLASVGAPPTPRDLPAMIAGEKAAAAKAESTAAALSAETTTGATAKRYARTNQAALDALELMISRHKLDARRHYVLTTTQFLQAKCTATRLKLRALLLRVRQRAMKPPSAAALLAVC